MKRTDILVVEKDPEVSCRFKQYFQNLGHCIYETVTLTEAFKIASNEEISTILVDLNVSDENHLEWVSEMKDEFPESAILVLTEKNDLEAAFEALRKGADYFITKPVEWDELGVIFEKCLELVSLRYQSRLRFNRPIFPASKEPKEQSAIGREIQQMEAAHIRKIIERCGGNINTAARVLGLSRATLYRHLSRLKAP